MTITAPPVVDNLPEPPNPADRLTFNSKAYPWSLALGDMTTDMNNIAAWNYNTAIETQTNANSAQASASNAAAAASAAALNAPGTITTTTETITFGTGSKTFQVPAGKSYVAGQYVLVAQTSAPSNYMVGQVTSYNTATGVLILNVVTNTGSGSASAWTFSLTSPPSNQLIYAAADKATPADSDIFGYLDSAASFVFKRLTFANLKTWIASYLNTGVSGNILSLSGLIGYSAGAGATVIQLTSKSTSVPLNKPTGVIVMHNENMTSGQEIVFSCHSSLISENSFVGITLVNSSVIGADRYNIRVLSVASGAVVISVKNISTVTLGESIRLQLVVIRGSSS